jgi:hypothetical protein
MTRQEIMDESGVDCKGDCILLEECSDCETINANECNERMFTRVLDAIMRLDTQDYYSAAALEMKKQGIK